MLQNIIDKQVLQSGLTGSTTYSDWYEMSRYEAFSIQNVIDVNTPAAVVVPSSDISTTDDSFTKTAHGLFTGLKGQFTTSTTLPTGIVALTDYFIIVISSSVFKVASSYNLAIAGTPIDITGAGVGNQTFTPTALAGATIVYQISNDGTNGSDYAAATAITADATQWFLGSAIPSFKYVRWGITLTAGSISTTNNIFGRGEQS